MFAPFSLPWHFACFSNILNSISCFVNCISTRSAHIVKFHMDHEPCVVQDPLVFCYVCKGTTSCKVELVSKRLGLSLFCGTQ